MPIPRSTDQAETVSRRIEKFADLMQSIWVSRNDYERRVRAVSDKVFLRSRWAKVERYHSSLLPSRRPRKSGLR